MSDSQKQTTGAILRARRQELGLSLDAVAQRTRIRKSYLEALEGDRPEAFPGEAYRSGFLRTYAGVLGLKAEPLLAQEDFRRPAEPKSTLPEIASPRGRKSGKGGIALVAAALLIVGAIVSAGLLRNPPAPAQDGPRTVAEAPLEAEAPLTDNPGEAVVVSPPSGDEGESTGALQGGGIEDGPGSPAVSRVPEGMEGVTRPGDTVQVESASPGESQIKIPETSPGSATSPAPLPPLEAGAEEATVAPEPLRQVVAETPAPAPSENVIRLVALGTNQIELILDNRPPQRYELKAETELSWKVRRSALIRVDDPSMVRLWLDDRPLDMGEKNQLLVQAGADPPQEGQ